MKTKFELEIYEWNIYSGNRFIGSVPFSSREEAELFLDCYNSKNVFPDTPKFYTFTIFKLEDLCTKN